MQTSPPTNPVARHTEREKRASLTRSASHSLLQVLCASTHRLGFMSLGHIPAWEYRIGGRALPFRETSRSKRTLLFPSKIHIHRVNSTTNISELLQGNGSDQAGGSSCLLGVAFFFLVSLKFSRNPNAPDFGKNFSKLLCCLC